MSSKAKDIYLVPFCFFFFVALKDNIEHIYVLHDSLDYVEQIFIRLGLDFLF